MRRAERRFVRSWPQARFRLRTGSEIVPELLQEAASLHSRNQYRQSGASVFSDERFGEFLSRVSQRDDVGLWLAALEDDEWMAFNLGFRRGRTLYGDIQAYEERYRAAP